MSALRHEEILEDLYISDSSSIGLQNLAAVLETDEEKIKKALKLTAQSNQLEITNTSVKKWLTIFNLIIDLIQQTGIFLDC